MNIELNKLNIYGEIIINEKIEFNYEDIKRIGLKELNNIWVSGKIFLDTMNNIVLDLKLSGNMILVDALNLEDVVLPLDIEIKETIENEDIHRNNQNTLELSSILWQNVVLEVPIRATNNKSLDITSGEGWELVSEGNKKIDPRLAPLAALLDEGKER